MRRQIALYLAELEEFPQIRHGHTKAIEEFADLLDIAMINPQEARQHHELGVGLLYAGCSARYQSNASLVPSLGV